jgi:hypothetical protein
MNGALAAAAASRSATRRKKRDHRHRLLLFGRFRETADLRMDDRGKEEGDLGSILAAGLG